MTMHGPMDVRYLDVLNMIKNLQVAKKMRGISWLAEELLASQASLYSMKLFYC